MMLSLMPTKSKCIVLKPRCSDLPTTNLGFQIGGNEIEIVDEWPHLGHIILPTDAMMMLI